MDRVHYKSNIKVKKLIYYRPAQKEPSQVALNWVKKLHFVYLLQAGECNFFHLILTQPGKVRFFVFGKIEDLVKSHVLIFEPTSVLFFNYDPCKNPL